MRDNNLFCLSMLRLVVAGVVFALAVAVTFPVEAERPRGNHHARQAREMQAQQRMMQNMEKQALNQEKQFENNVRTFVLLLNEDDIQRKIGVTKVQKEKLADIDKKYEEAREKLLHPNGSKFNSREEAVAAVEKNKEKLQELSLNCGKAIMNVLDKEQINAYGRHVTMERIEKAWERKMGVPLEKPDNKEPEKKFNKK